LRFAFNASDGPVIVRGSCSGPTGQVDLRLLLDTGATTSLVRRSILVAVGYDPDASSDRVKVAMGNGVEAVPRMVLNRFSALDVHRLAFPVLGHTLPEGVEIDGLLGLDFLRGAELTLDFRLGRIDLR
jgi:Aspartyl protease